MNCWHCDRPGHGVCVFCGRAVCKTHTKEMPRIISTYMDKKDNLMAIGCDGTVYCGVCEPKGEPVKLDEI